MRLISRNLNAVLEQTPPPPVNFGLTFNKFLKYNHQLKPQGKECPGTTFEHLYRAPAKFVEQALRQRHLKQAAFCRSMAECGALVHICHARLSSRYISGLGMGHPTETGLVLDHTLGVPYIPAAGVKGVCRLAGLLNDLRTNDGEWRPCTDFTQNGNELLWNENDIIRTVFGFSGKEKNASLAGGVFFLDAYPLSMPQLAEDILNPHYGDYYRDSGAQRGPTEDQSPVPIKFLTVEAGQEFIFRLIIRRPFSAAPVKNQEQLRENIEQALVTALTEEGLGGKTALGYGRFEILGQGAEEPERISDWIQEQEPDWKKLRRKIEKIDNWGAFKTLVLNNPEAQKYRKMQDFTIIVKQAAVSLANQNRKRWTRERDQEVADWLQEAGCGWEPLASSAKKAEPDKTNKNSELLESIEKLTGWDEYKKAGIKINKLDFPCAGALKQKLAAWGCKKSKDKQQKKAYEQITKRLKSLRQ